MGFLTDGEMYDRSFFTIRSRKAPVFGARKSTMAPFCSSRNCSSRNIAEVKDMAPGLSKSFGKSSTKSHNSSYLVCIIKDPTTRRTAFHATLLCWLQATPMKTNSTTPHLRTGNRCRRNESGSGERWTSVALAQVSFLAIARIQTMHLAPCRQTRTTSRLVGCLSIQTITTRRSRTSKM